MSTQDTPMNDMQLDAALDRLQPPVPSETLVRRVHAMAPTAPRRMRETGQKAIFTPLRAAAAALVMAVAAAALLHMSSTGNTPAAPAAPVATVTDPAGEIPLPALALGDEPVGAAPAAPFSMAGMPLE